MTLSYETLSDLRWECSKCGAKSTGRGLTPSIDPRYRLGRCQTCGPITWRAYDSSVDAEVGMQRQRIGQIAVMGAQSGDWKARARNRALTLAATLEPFTSQDITDSVGLPEHRNAVGALLGGLSRQGHIRRIGDQLGTRASQQGRRIGVWRGNR